MPDPDLPCHRPFRKVVGRFAAGAERLLLSNSTKDEDPVQFWSEKIRILRAAGLRTPSPIAALDGAFTIRFRQSTL